MTDTATNVPQWYLDAQANSLHKWYDKPLPLASLEVLSLEEGGYQRPLKDARVNHLVTHFDAGEARTIFVSERANGTYVILDGQHTSAALQKVGISEWPCRIFKGMTLEDEAAHFSEYQKNVIRIPSVVEYNAQVMSGEKTANALEHSLSQRYLRISTSKLRSREGFIPVTSRAAFEKILNWGGSRTLDEVLDLVIDSWRHSRDAFNNRVLVGLGYLLSATEEPFDRGRMVAVLANTTPKLIEGKVGPTGSGGAARSIALAIIELYVEGAGGYPRIRINAKEVPRVQEKLDFHEHDIWTLESKDEARTKLTPFVAPPKAERKKRVAVNESEPGVPKASDDGEDTLEDTLDEGTSDDIGDVSEASEGTPEASVTPQETDDDWSYQEPVEQV